MREAAAQLPGAAPTSSPNKRRRSGGPRAAAWQPWQHSAAVLARGGRLAKELLQEATDCCRVRGLRAGLEAAQGWPGWGSVSRCELSRPR